MINIIKEHTLCVTGHRKLNNDLNLKHLELIFSNYIENGIDTFLIGMALGFDSVCFKILEKLKNQKEFNHIKLIACIPCPEQDKYFSYEQKKEYLRMLQISNETITICPNYTHYCMSMRNRFMVDNSIIVVCYLREKKGGTYNTVNYAKKQGKVVIEL